MPSPQPSSPILPAALGRVDPHSGGELDPLARERSVSALADRQHGVVSRRQLLNLGISRRAIERRLAAGRLHELHRGIYAVGRRRLTRHGRWMAAVLACGPGALLSHGHAAHLWGLRPFSRGWVEVTVPGRSGRRRPGLVIHRPRHLDKSEIDEVAAIPCTSWARTLLDNAPRLHAHQLARALEEAEKQRILDIRQIDAVLALHPRHPGARRLGAALGATNSHTDTRSDNEALIVHLCRQADLPLPQTNVALTLNGRTLVVDALWPRQRLIVEVDSHTHHATRAALTRDHVRDADAQEAGFLVLRLDDAQLAQPRTLVERLRRLLSRSLH